MWQSQTAPAYAALRRLGFTAGALAADRERGEAAGFDRRTAALRAGGLRWYVENLATDFYAPYHRWTADHPVNWLYDETVRRWRENPADPTVFWRTPSLSDPEWQARIGARLAEAVRTHGAYRPLFYNLADEAGIADLSAAWDFDRSPAALADFRAWLRTQYADVAAVSAEWGRTLADWDAAVPDTTFEVMRRPDGNWASWSDGRAFMDEAFARAVRRGADAVHEADPAALAGIEGAQLAGWGGYDYGRLAPSVDVMEIYGDNWNVEAAADCNPALVTLGTVAGSDARAEAETWRNLLRGNRGVVLWDDAHALVDEQGRVHPAGASLARLFATLQGPLGTAWLAGMPAHDAVAILYSQPSFRIQWMFDRKPGGDAWVARGADGENDDNAWRAAMRHAAEHFVRLGVRPRWITPATLAGGVPAGTRVLVLPHVIAMSEAEAESVRRFVASGGTVLSDGPSGQYDEHGRQRSAPLLPEPRGAGEALFDDPDSRTLREVGLVLARAGAEPAARIETAAGELALRIEARWRVAAAGGSDRLLALLPLDEPAPQSVVSVILRRPGEARGLRGTAERRSSMRFDVTLPASGPAMIAISGGAP